MRLAEALKSELTEDELVDLRPKHAPPTFNNTDLGNAGRFAYQHSKNVKFCHAWNKWLIWNGKRWQIDQTAEIMRLARDTVRSIYGETERAGDEAERKAIAKHAMRSEAESKIRAMLELAKSEEGIPVLPEAFDNNSLLLNCNNGVTDLKTGELLPHKREFLMTKKVKADFDQGAKAPTWEKFLNQIMNGNENLIGFLQRAVGYSLTGNTSEQCLFLLHGSGANGKSTFLETISLLMGDYAKKTRTSTLMTRKNESISNDVAALCGARMVTASETNENERFDEAKIKEMTGGDTISARFMRAEFFEFVPQFKLWLCCNHKPQIKGQDTAIWRRIHLIPFNLTIPEAERDKDLPAKLKEELPGILRWAVIGCLNWYDWEGFRTS